MKSTKYRWADDQDQWLEYCFCTGYSLEAMAKASGRTAKAIRMRATRLLLHRPPNYKGRAATQIARNLPIIPNYPGANLPFEGTLKNLPRDQNGRYDRVIIPREFDLQAHLRPASGWQRRCEGCSAVFSTADLAQIYCPACLEACQAGQERHAKAPRPKAPEKSPMKTSSWLD